MELLVALFVLVVLWWLGGFFIGFLVALFGSAIRLTMGLIALVIIAAIIAALAR